MADVTCVNNSGQTVVIRLADDSELIETLETLKRRGDLDSVTVGSKPKTAAKPKAAE